MTGSHPLSSSVSLSALASDSPARTRKTRLAPASPTLAALVLPNEDADAALTGSTRSLTRRLIALNLQAQPFVPTRTTPLSIRRSA